MSRGPLIIDLDGYQLTHEEKEIVKHPLIGGIIYFTKNYDSLTQLAELSQSIKKIRPELIICVDQEGGRVQRLSHSVTPLPSMQSLASNFTLNQVQAAGTLMSLEMQALGIDMSFTPVLDCDRGDNDIVKTRAFASTPNEVATYAKAFYSGMKCANMPGTGKHFPGHGGVQEDSHLSLPIDNRAMSQLKEDIYPFKALIDEGLEAMMTAHIIYPEVDNKPASFSKKWLNDILRETLKFKGAIFSDDLAMKGAASIGTYFDRVQLALEAGTDFTLICHQRKEVLSILNKHTQLKLNNPNYRNSIRLNPSKINWESLKSYSQYQNAKQVYTLK